MGNLFVDAMLSSTTSDLRTLLRLHYPDTDDLNRLISTLIEQQANERLQTLIGLLQEDSQQNNQSIIIQIACQWLMSALQQSNRQGVEQALEPLGGLAPETGPGSNILAQLSSWINTFHQPDTLLHLLKNLPPALRLQLYKRLFETVDGDPPWLPTLLSFVLNHPDRNNRDEVMAQPIQELATIVLLSAAACHDNQIRALSLCISTAQLIDVTFQLRALAASYYSADHSRENARFGSKRQTYLDNYDTLVMALTVRASSDPHEYQRLVASNSELANLLMSKRIKTLTSVQAKAELSNEILANCHLFNWQDLPFAALINDHLLQQFSEVPTDELRTLFARYAAWHNSRNPGDVVHFLDLFFEKTQRIDKVLLLINDSDNQDKTLSINFITQSRSRSPELTECLFERLDALQLIALCGHVLALRHILQRESGSLATIYCRVLGKKIQDSPHRRELLEQWANTLALLPQEAQEEQIAAAFQYFDAHAEWQLDWLMALMGACHNKEPLLAHCQRLSGLVIPASRMRLFHSLLPETLLQLYTFMLARHALPTEFHAFVELFKTESAQNALHYLLLNTPITDQTFLARLLPLIEENQLVRIVDQLIDRADGDPAYRGPLDQTLIYLSALLLNNSMNPEHPCHGWIEATHHVRIAERFLATPDCFCNLASRSTLMRDYTPRVFQGYAVYGPGDDLKYRAIRILDHVACDDEKIRAVALRLLSHFRDKPKILQTMFVNLEDARASFGDNGQKYYQQLLRTCWFILHPDASDSTYQEQQCVTLMTSRLGKAHRFDYLLTTLLSNLCDSGDTAQGAHYLTQIEPDAISAINDRTLANILLDSEQSSTLGNWGNVAKHLDNRPADQILAFIRVLIEQTQSRQNPPSQCEKTRQLLLNLAHFKEIIPLLHDNELRWLLQNCPADLLITQFPSWLDILLQHQRFDENNAASLLPLLPPDPAFLNGLYQRADLRPCLQPLFIRLARQEPGDACANERNDHHFIALLNQISLQSEGEKRQFLIQAQQQIQARATIVAPVLNMLLLSLDDLDACDIRNQTLVADHLRFLGAQAEDRSIAPDQRPAVHQMLEQLVLNTFTSLTHHDPAWAYNLLNSAAFAKSVLFWLATIHVKMIARHPFTSIILDNAHATLHPALVNNHAWQNFLDSLLSAPPADMNEVQFQLLFATLTLDAQQALARNILQRPSLEDVQWFSLITLSRALPVDALYGIFETSKTRFIFVDLLFRHPQGLEQLTDLQKNTLANQVISAKQVLRILDSQSPVATKFAFVQSLFHYLAKNQTGLLAWLNDMNFDSQALAALANFTISPRHQRQFQEALSSRSWRQQEIQDYLKAPNLDMPIQKQGFLYNQLKNTWLTPELGHVCHPRLFAVLDPDTAQRTLRAHFNHLQLINRLPAFYAPLTGCQETTSELLTSAQWIHRLPLLSEGLFDIIFEYRNTPDEETREAIESSQLYQQIIYPMLYGHAKTSTHPVKSVATEFIDHTVDLFDDYLTRLPDTSSHYLRIHETHSHFLQQVRTLESTSPAKLAQWINPASRLTPDKQPERPKLDASETNYLASAAQHHDQRMHERNIVPAQRLKDLLICASKHPGGVIDEACQDWLLKQVLLSPLSRDWHGTERNQILSRIPMHNFMQSMESHYLRLQQCAKPDRSGKVPFDTLKSMINTPLPAVIDSLLRLDRESLRQCQETSELLQLPYWHALLSLMLLASQSRISTEAILTAFPDPASNHSMEMEWLRQELTDLDVRRQALIDHCKEAITERLLYRHDEEDIERLIRIPRQQKRCDLALCLNSYLPAFSENRSAVTDQLLQTLTQLLAYPELAKSLPVQLDASLIETVLLMALQEPERHEALIRQIIQVDPGGKHLAILQNQLRTRLAILASKPQTMAQLSLGDLAALSESDSDRLLITQRLLYHVAPIDELSDWRINGKDMPETNRAFLCADASLLSVLNHIGKSLVPSDLDPASESYARRYLNRCFLFLREKSHGLSYYTAGEALTAQQASAWYHYVYLLAFLTDQYDGLLTNFLTRLQVLTPDELKNQPWLEKWLAIILDQDLLNSLCQRLEKKPLGNEEQAAWLFTTSLRLKPDNHALIHNIGLACSWPWLMTRIRAADVHRMDWLRTALESDAHSRAILRDEQSILSFLDLLAQCRFPPNDVIRLCALKINPALQSLLAAHLLNRDDYLSRLGGQSLLANLSSQAERRLTPVVRQVNLAGLPVSALQHWLPEAAATLLCTVKQFHLLSEERLLPLLAALGAQREAFISYWLTHYAAMPGADTPFQVLVRHHPKLILPALALAPHAARKIIIRRMIRQCQQWNYFSTLSLPGFSALCDEPDLQFAMTRFWHGHQQDDILIAVIQALIKSVADPSGHLSLPTIQLLVKLGENPAFNAVQDRIDQATGDHLKHHALLANCSVFYDNGQINVQRLNRLISLRPDPSCGNETTKGLFQKVGAVLSLLLPAAAVTQPDEDSCEKSARHTLVDELPVCFNSITAINYFLIHFRGESASLSSCLHDYFQSIKRWDEDSSPPETLLVTALLLNQTDLPISTRAAIFNKLLEKPDLLRGGVAAQALQFDSESLLSHFGMMKRYDLLMQLASSALQHDRYGDDNPDTIMSARTRQNALNAIREAQFETSLQNVGGIFSGWRIWFRRCNFYGWTGFFRPRQPQFVIAFDRQIVAELANSPTTVLRTLRHQTPTPSSFPALSNPPAENAPLSAFAAWYQALLVYNSQDHDKESEYATRPPVDKVFSKLLLRTKTLGDEHELGIWLRSSCGEFVCNRQRLLDLYSQDKRDTEFHALMKIARHGPGAFDVLARESGESGDMELLPEENAPAPEPGLPSRLISGIVNGVTTSLGTLGSLGYKGASYLWSKPDKIMTSATTSTTSESQGGWFGRKGS